MSAHAMPWPDFGWRGRGRDPVRALRMAAGAGGRRGAGPSGFWGDPRGGGFRPPFPPMPPFPHGFGPPHGDPRQWGGRPWGGPKVRRGDVRAAVLALLAEEPRNGYQIIQEIAERSGGVWRPSAGSVYPALQQLEDEGLVEAVESGGRRLFELTDEGRTYIESHKKECAAPWEAVYDSVGEEAIELRHLIGGVAGAAVQVLQAGSPAQTAEVRRVLTDARRSLYRILAEDEPAGDGTNAADDADDAENRFDNEEDAS